MGIEITGMAPLLHNAAYSMRQLYLHDPHGYNICFQWPVGESTD
jgi:hypothetical protein